MSQGPSSSQGPSQAPAGSNNNQGVNKTNAFECNGKQLVIREQAVNGVEGRLVIEVDGRTHTFIIRRHGKTFDIENAETGMSQTKKKLGELLSGLGLGPVRACIESLIHTIARRIEEAARQELEPKLIIIDSKNVNDGVLDVGIKTDGSLVFRYHGPNVNDMLTLVPGAGVEQARDWLAKYVPIDDPQKTSEFMAFILSAVDKARRMVMPSRRGGYVITQDINTKYVKSAVVVGDELIHFYPTVVRVNDRDDVATLSIVARADPAGGAIIEQSDYAIGEGEVIINNVRYASRFTAGLVVTSFLRDILPSRRKIDTLYNVLERLRLSNTKLFIRFDKVFDYIYDLLGRYVEMVDKYRVIAALYIIANYFSDILYKFPILVILGERGSGKRQLAMVLSASAPLRIDVTHPTEAAIYTLTENYHAVMIIDETAINDALADILNAAYEAGHKIPRVNVLDKGSRAVYGYDPYGPKILIMRLGVHELRDDAASRTVIIHMLRASGRTFPDHVDEHHEDALFLALSLLKFSRFGDFLSAYQFVRDVMKNMDQRTLDAYAPLLAVAFLVVKDSGFKSEYIKNVFEQVLEDFIIAAGERGGAGYIVNRVVSQLIGYIAWANDDDLHFVRDGWVRICWNDVREVLNRVADPSNRDEYRPRAEDFRPRDRDGTYFHKVLGLRPVFVLDIKKTEGRVCYVISIAQLVAFAMKYHVDLSFLSEEDWEVLRDRAGEELESALSEGTEGGESGDIECRFFPDYCKELEAQVQAQAQASQSQSQQAEASQSEQKVTESGSGGQTEQTNQQVSTVPSEAPPRPQDRPDARELWCSSECTEWYRADAQKLSECVSKCRECKGVFDPATMTCRSTSEPLTTQSQSQTAEASQANPPGGGNNTGGSTPEPQSTQSQQATCDDARGRECAEICRREYDPISPGFSRCLDNCCKCDGEYDPKWGLCKKVRKR